MINDHTIILKSLKGVKIFISGRKLGLEEEREFADEFLANYGATVIRFEKVGSLIEPSKACREWASSCDLFLGIYGGTYGGYVENGKSATEIEFDKAKSTERNMLIFLKDESQDTKQKAFIKKIRAWDTGLNIPSFSNATELLVLLKNSLESILADIFTKDPYIQLIPEYEDVSFRPLPQVEMDNFLDLAETEPDLVIGCNEELNEFPENIQKIVKELCNEYNIATKILIFRHDDVISVRFTYT